MKKRCLLLALCLLLASVCVTARAQTQAVLTLSADQSSGYGGDVVTISLHLSAENVGGLQTTLSWNTGYLTYVEGSAAFSDEFAAQAMIQLVNDQTEGAIRLVYGSTGGYTAQGECVFTAQFCLTENVSGDTQFTLADTKVSDASSSVEAMAVETYGVCVQTTPYDAGSVQLTPSVDESYPQLGSTVQVTLCASPSAAMGSLQGTLVYNPEVLEYVADSAAFTQAYADAGMTMLFNAATPGEIKFVYASATGCMEYNVATMQFKVIGGLHEYASVDLIDVKATNASTDHLAMMEAWYWGTGFWPQPERDTAYYTAYYKENEVLCGQTVTLAIRLEGDVMGGTQGTILYDADKLSYISGSAAFTDAFAQGAAVQLLNDAAEGKIQFVCINTNGFEPNGGDMLTARFVLNSPWFSETTLSGVKTTSAGETLEEMYSQIQQSGRPWQDHDYAERNGIPATCTETGISAESYCAGCGEVFNVQEELPALGHIEAWIAPIEPTCTESGWTEGWGCGNCGEVYTAPEEIPALGHDEYYAGSWDAWCESPGYVDLISCYRCGGEVSYAEKFPALEHTEVYCELIDPGCGWYGYKGATQCERCGMILSWEVEIPPTGEHVEQYQPAYPPTCTSDGYTEGVTCATCGQWLSGMDWLPATGHAEVWAECLEPTCDQPGYTNVTYCTVCNEVISYDEWLPSLGHNEVLDAGYPATCTEDGLSDGWHCITCGQVTMVQQTIPALGHSEAWIAPIEPTCTESGWTEGWGCGNCGEVYTAPEEIPALGHDEYYAGSWDAWCESPGYVDLISCYRCGGEVSYAEKFPALGHTEVYCELIDPGCGWYGYKGATQCERCGMLFSWEEEIPPTGEHDICHQEGTPPTCTETGWTETEYCTMCGEIYLATEEIPALGHMPTDVPALPPTHITPGRTAGSCCANCGEVYDGLEEIPAVDIETLCLPAQLIILEDEAFAGCTFGCIVLPQGCSSIGARTFADCTALRFVEIPASVAEIDESAFTGSNADLIIVTTHGSVAQSFAEANGLQCVLMTDD